MVILYNIGFEIPMMKKDNELKYMCNARVQKTSKKKRKILKFGVTCIKNISYNLRIISTSQVFEI